MKNSDKQSRDKLLKAIQQLKKNPQDRVRILGEVGIVGIGAAGAGAAAAIAGASTVPIGFGVTALTGFSMVVAAPAVVVAGGAVAGGVAAYGVARLITNGARQEGKLKQLREHLEEILKDIEERERKSTLTEQDKTDFIICLEDPIRFNLISVDDAQTLIEMVEQGKISLLEAYQQIDELLAEHAETRSKRLLKDSSS